MILYISSFDFTCIHVNIANFIVVFSSDNNTITALPQEVLLISSNTYLIHIGHALTCANLPCVVNNTYYLFCIFIYKKIKVYPPLSCFILLYFLLLLCFYKITILLVLNDNVY